MPWTPPTKHLRRKELLDSKRFYRLLSEHSNYIDQESVARVYLGLVMLIDQELRKNKFVRLPILGDFALVRQKSRPAWVGGAHCVIEGREVAKFYMKEDFRRHINKRQPTQPLSPMPPRPIE
jgi:nucleoid DNA-binding protein